MIRVTFTGIDKKTDVNKLVELQTKYPDIEFGFLISSSNTGNDTNNRYPSLITLQKLKNKGLNLSLHVCGKLVRNIAKTGSLEEVKEFMGPYFDMFNRIQLNLVGSTVKYLVTDTLGKQVIIQTNLDEPKSNATYQLYLGAKMDNIVFLSDKSGGHGTVEDFDYFDVDYQGFAGGINPDNVLERKEEADILWEKDYWLDMESGVRTDDWFDLNKVEQVCQKVFNY